MKNIEVQKFFDTLQTGLSYGIERFSSKPFGSLPTGSLIKRLKLPYIIIFFHGALSQFR